MKSTLVLGISTARDNIKQIQPLLESARDFDQIIICHQSFEEKAATEAALFAIAPFLERYLDRMTLIRQAGKGLARSRNAILKACPEDVWLVPTDDDILLHPKAASSILTAIKATQNAGVIAFKAYSDPEGNVLYKNTYKEHTFRHTRFSIRSISSIEIIVNVLLARQKHVVWDERFGLGAKFGGGLENVFLQNVYDADLSIYYWPALLCYHPAESSGAIFDERKAYIRGAVAVRTLGTLFALFLAIVTTLRHRNRIRKHTKSFSYFRSFLRGGLDFLRTKNS